jgi:hypothetical protein
VKEKLGTRRAGSNFPCASWKDFQAPTRVGEGKVRNVNRVAAVGVRRALAASCPGWARGRAGLFLYTLPSLLIPNFLSVSKPGSRPHTYLGYIILCAVPFHVPMGHPYLGGNTQNAKVKGQCHEIIAESNFQKFVEIFAD